MTTAAVRRQLAEEDAITLEKSLSVQSHGSMPPSIMIAAGLDLEDQQ